MINAKNIFLLIFIIGIILLIQSCDRNTDITTTGDSIPPGVPENIQVSDAFDGEVWLTWQRNVEVDFNHYNIYRKQTEADTFRFVARMFTNKYFDDSLAYDTPYQYYVTAVDEYDNESQASDTVSATPMNKYTPYPPRFLEINARNWEGEKSFYLSWYTYIPESDIIGYEIYRSDSADFTPDSTHFVGFSAKTIFSDTSNAEFYTMYYYKVRTVDRGGLKSSFPDAVSDMMLPIPKAIFPKDMAETTFFTEFYITSLEMPTTYEIVIQKNPYSDDIWRTSIYSEAVNDTLAIPKYDAYLDARTIYYWRIVTYTSNSSTPNSISKPIQFIITDWF